MKIKSYLNNNRISSLENTHKGRNILVLFAILSGFISPERTWAQLNSCDANVPYFFVDLSSDPLGSWVSPSHKRVGHCCNTTGSDECTSFEILLNPEALLVSLEIMDGAVPPGALYYQIDCGPMVKIGEPICLQGVGPHNLTFCKPGGNENIYKIQAYPDLIFPKDDTIRVDCTPTYQGLGFNDTTLTWNSVYPGNPGDYNYTLSCTSGCDSIKFLPPSGPAYIDFQVCGRPAQSCFDKLTTQDYCDTFRVIINQRLTGSIIPDPAYLCPGQTDIVLTANPQGGDSAYTYTWRNDQNISIGSQQSTTVNSIGNYTVEIMDGMPPAICPSIFINSPVTQVEKPIVNAGSDQIICASSPVINLNGSSNTAGLLWSGGNGTFDPGPDVGSPSYSPTPAEISNGSITLTLQSTGINPGCLEEQDQVMIRFSDSIFASIKHNNILCYNDQTGIMAEISGGIPPYNYLWNTGEIIDSINYGAGYYCVNVTDSIGCGTSVCDSIIQPPPLALTITGYDVTTNGGNDGKATTNVSGGTLPYQYTWPDSSTLDSIQNLYAGSYILVVEDSNNCNINSTITINEPGCNTLELSITKTDILCFGESNGTATGIVNGGVPPYSYLWTDPLGQTTSTANNLGPGTISLEITDSVGCVKSGNITILQPVKLTGVLTTTNVTTVGGSDGTANADGSGGTMPYYYQWSNGDSVKSTTGLTQGAYTVTITDNNNCQVNYSVFISEPPCPSYVVNYTKKNLSCFKSSDGEIEVYITQGNPPYEFLWNTGDTTATISNLPIGTYNLQVKNLEECIQNITVTLSEPAMLTSNLTTNKVTCYGANNGSLEVEVSGGTFPYTYSWSNGVTVSDQFNIGPGYYEYLVTDAKGCTSNGNSTITQPPLLSIGITETEVLCKGWADGAINIYPSGGTIPYTYSWAGPSGFTSNNEDLQNLFAGNYTLSFTDANGCLPEYGPSVIIAIQEPDTFLSAEIINLVNNLCKGDSIGSAEIFTNGGSGNYTYQWDPGVGLDSIAQNLKAGTYTVTVKDQNGCPVEVVKDFIILEPTGFLNADIISKTDIFCKYDSTGSAEVLATGGSGAYNYIWNTDPVQNNKEAEKLKAGTYSVSVWDANGCTVPVMAGIEIMEPENALSGSITYKSDNLCKGDSIGSSTITVSGGSGSYVYAWNTEPVQTTATATNLKTGNYIITVYDNNGCTKPVGDSVAINEPEYALNSTVISILDNLCKYDSAGSATVQVTGGSGNYSYSWNTTPPQNNPTAIKLKAGTYTATVFDNNGCIEPVVSIAIIGEPGIILSADISSSTNNLCRGDSAGEAKVIAAGGSGTYIYSWNTSPVMTKWSISDLIAGMYSVTVSDANGCTINVQDTVQITEPLNYLGVELISKSDNFCKGDSVGTANAIASGGSGNYNYSWNTVPEQNTPDASNLKAGEHTLRVFDANGCNVPVYLTVEILEPENGLSVANTSQENNLCKGDSIGTASITAYGGSGNYAYSWNTSPIQNAQTAINLKSGVYIATIYDLNGCNVPLQTSIEITEPEFELSILSKTTSDNLCKGDSIGLATIQIYGGSGSYNYSWNTIPIQKSQTAVNLQVGKYIITVKDSNGCVIPVIDSVQINEPESILSSSILSKSDILCKGDSTGNASVIVTGGSGNYIYSWNTLPVQNASNANALAAGNYVATIYDANGCMVPVSNSVTILEPESKIELFSTDLSGNLCKGDSLGFATIMATGGSGEFLYTWNSIPEQNESTAINLKAGKYTVTVSDSNGCTDKSFMEVEITEPEFGISTNISVNNIKCHGDSSGSIIIEATGGSGNYNFLWSNNSNGNNALNLKAGTYSVVISDQNGCREKINIIREVAEPAQLILPHQIINDYCNKGEGAINLSPDGGLSPYRAYWSNGYAGTTINGLHMGNYTVAVIDSNQCKSYKTIFVNNESPISGKAMSTNSCNENATGTIYLEIQSSEKYDLYWENGDPIMSLENLAAGNYSIKVLTENGCSLKLNSSIAEYEVLEITSTSTIYENNYNISRYGGNDGTCEVNITGGTSPYYYNWTNGDTTYRTNNLSAGIYEVKITDANNCTATMEISLNQPDPLDIPNGFSPNNDGKNDLFKIQGLDAFLQNKLEIFNRWGNIIFKSDNYSNNWAGTNDDGETLPTGTYFYILELPEIGTKLTGYVDLKR